MIGDIKSQTRAELAEQFRSWGEPAYRLDQLLCWLYGQRVTSWDAMSNLPLALRERLGQHYTLRALELVRQQGANDTTRKFLWRLHDHALVESVLIPSNPALSGEPSDRRTLCVSTQVGCAYGCKFCASGLAGWKRNLEADEIVEQVLAVERWHAGECARTPAPESLPPEVRLVDNLVIMGMGEPLANYDHLLKALTILNASWGGAIGARKITISTSGLAPQIRRLADEPFQFRLAISLHGATDLIRSILMPVNRKYPLAELVAACEYYLAKQGRMLTFEYILIAGVNDALDQVAPLAALAHRLHAKVNLIPYNHVDDLPWQRPDEQAQETFLAALTRRGVPTTLRREKGQDIDAACGQLRLKTERELADRIAKPGALNQVQCVIALIDYGAGNLRSVEKALRFVGAELRLVTRPEGLRDAAALVLPGVGAFDDCLNALQRQELAEASREFIRSGRLFLGICIGYQALFERSEEFNSRAAGLGLFPGNVVRFRERPGLKIPQIGWNQLEFTRPDCPLLQGVKDGSFVYFVHSYFPKPHDNSIVATRTIYGEPFASAVWRDNVFATQFHPEKSQQVGLQLLRNFVRLAQH